MDELKWALHTLMHDVGLTDKEVINLTIRDLQLAGSNPHLTVLDDDNGQERSVTLTDNARQALVRWMLARPDRPVTLLFPGEADGGLSVEGVKNLLTGYKPPVAPAPTGSPPAPSKNGSEKKEAGSSSTPAAKPAKMRPPATSPENLSRSVKPPPPITSPESLQPAASPPPAKKPSAKKPTPNTGGTPAVKPPPSQKPPAAKNVSTPSAKPAASPKVTHGPETISTAPATPNVDRPAEAEPASPSSSSVKSAAAKTPVPSPSPAKPTTPPISQAEKPTLPPKKQKRSLPLGPTLLVLLLSLGCFGLFLGSILLPGPLGSLATVPGTLMDQVGLGTQYAQLSTCIRTIAGLNDEQLPDAVAVNPTELPAPETATPVAETATLEATEAIATETPTPAATATPVPPTPPPTADSRESVPQIDEQTPVSPVATPTPEATDTPTATATPTETSTPSPTPTETPTETPTPAEDETDSEEAEPATTNPIKYAAPQLLMPEPNFRFIQGNTVLLQWEPVAEELAPDEQYAVRLVYFHANEPVYKGEQVREPEWMVPFALYREADGPKFEYFWYVYVERVLADGTTVTISPESETRFFTWD